MLLPIVGVIAAAVRNDLTDRSGMLASPWLVKLGAWSFALYLVHAGVLRTLELLVREPTTAAAVAIAVVTVVGSVALSGAFHEWFEAPVERRLRAQIKPRDVRAALVGTASEAR